jgi:hypothetical protein
LNRIQEHQNINNKYYSKKARIARMDMLHPQYDSDIKLYIVDLKNLTIEEFLKRNSLQGLKDLKLLNVRENNVCVPLYTSEVESLRGDKEISLFGTNCLE